MKKNKKIIFASIAFISVLIVIVLVYFFTNKQETYIWTLIPETPYNLDEVFPESPETPIVEESQEDTLSSKIRMLCDLWSSKNIQTSTIWQILKKDILKNIDQRYILLNLPNLVIKTCAADYDNLYLQQIILYLRSDDDVMVIYDEENVRKIWELIQNISFDSTWMDKKRLREDGEHFKKIFFEQNLTNLMSVYFSDYMINKNEPKKFFKSYSFDTFENRNSNFDMLLQKFNKFLNTSNFSWIEDFRDHVKKFYNINSKEDLVVELNEKYLSFEKKLLDEMKIDLTVSMKHMQALEDFYLWDEFKKIKENKEFYDLFLELWEKHFLFSLLSDDYVDWLDESWSWKEFFWDEHVGKFLPRLGYLYMLDKSNQ